MRLTKDLVGWFDHRLKIGEPIKDVMEHRVPRNTRVGPTCSAARA